MEKYKSNTTKAHIHQPKEILQHKIHKELKPGLVASYDIRPGNGVRLFWFRRFTNLSLTYLLRHLLTAPDPHGAPFDINRSLQIRSSYSQNSLT